MFADRNPKDVAALLVMVERDRPTPVRTLAPEAPPELVTKLNSALVAAIRAPATAERMRGMGVEPTGTTADALAVILKTDYERWGTVIKASGFKVDD